MKKICSLLLLCVMLLGVLPAVSFAEEEPELVKIAAYGENVLNGFENWRGEGSPQMRTHMLICIYSKTDFKDCDFRISLTNGALGKSIFLKPTSTYDAGEYILYRFQPVNGEGVNQFIPERGRSYSLYVEIFKNDEMIAYSEYTSGFQMDDTPILPGEEPSHLIIQQWPGVNWQNIAVVPNGPVQTQFLVVARSAKFMEGDYDWKITFNNGKSSVTVTLKSTSHFDLTSQVSKEDCPDGAALYRFEPCIAKGENCFVPRSGINYSIKVQILQEGKIIAETDETQNFGTAKDFEPIADSEPTLFPDEVKPEPEPEPDPTPSVKPEPKPSVKPTEKPAEKPSEKPAPSQPEENKKPDGEKQSNTTTVIIVASVVALCVIGAVVTVLVLKKKKK